MTLDSVFRIASMTKAITGTAAMQLVEKGRIGLEQPMGDVLPLVRAVKVLEGFDGDGHASTARSQNAGHAPPPADAHCRLWLRHLQPRSSSLRPDRRPAQYPKPQERRLARAIAIRSRLRLGIRHRPRSCRQGDRGGDRRGFGKLLPAA